MSAPEMVSATRAPNIFAVSIAAGNYGISRVLDRSINHTNFSCKFRLRALASHPFGAAVARSPIVASDARRERGGVHPLGEPEF
jgi:hypothetical protein